MTLLSPVPPAVPPGVSSPSALEASLNELRNALQQLRYGHIAVTVHDGKVVQIDITEKKRFA